MSRGARIKLEDVGRLGAGAQAQIRAALASGGPQPPAVVGIQPVEAVEQPRMRQNRGPQLNKTEAAFLAYLRANYTPDLQIEREGVTLLLANGVRYTADFAVFDPAGRVVLYEVKGGRFWDDAVVKLKVAADRYPRIAFWLASPADRARATWRLERVFPANKC